MRKAFNFYRSYYDVILELPDKEKLQFVMAILEKQFNGQEPSLTGLCKLAYISQKHSIDSQVVGYEHKTKTKLTPVEGGTQGGAQGGSAGGGVGGSVQEEEKGEEKEKYISPFGSMLEFLNSATGKKYKGDSKSKKHFEARTKDGYCAADFEKAISNAVADQYHRETKFKYITPEFITRADKLDKFLNANLVVKPVLNSGVPAEDNKW